MDQPQARGQRGKIDLLAQLNGGDQAGLLIEPFGMGITEQTPGQRHIGPDLRRVHAGQPRFSDCQRGLGVTPPQLMADQPCGVADIGRGAGAGEHRGCGVGLPQLIQRSGAINQQQRHIAQPGQSRFGMIGGFRVAPREQQNSQHLRAQLEQIGKPIDCGLQGFDRALRLTRQRGKLGKLGVAFEPAGIGA